MYNVRCFIARVLCDRIALRIVHYSPDGSKRLSFGRRVYRLGSRFVPDTPDW